MDTVDADRWYRIDPTAQYVAPVSKDFITRLARAFDANSAHGRFETIAGITYSVGAQLTDVEIHWLQHERR